MSVVGAHHRIIKGEVTMARKEQRTSSESSEKQVPTPIAEEKYVFHIGEGPDDFSAAASIWPKTYGDFAGNTCAASALAQAIRSGGLIMVRDRSDDHVVGATALDYSTSARSIFVRFNLVKEDEEDRALILRAQIQMVMNLLILRGLNRVVVHRDEDIADQAQIGEFDKLAQSYGIPIGVEILGTVSDLFGDGRNVSLTSIFIQPSDRPDLVSNVVNVAKTTADSAIRSARGLVFAAGICSGCKEGKEGGEKKDGKDGDKIAALAVPFTKMSLEVEAMSLFDVYRQVGIQRFDRYSGPSHYMALV
jgi:hypothetical protein